MKKFLDAFLPSLLVVVLVFAVSIATVAVTGDVRCLFVQCIVVK